MIDLPLDPTLEVVSYQTYDAGGVHHNAYVKSTARFADLQAAITGADGARAALLGEVPARGRKTTNPAVAVVFVRAQDAAGKPVELLLARNALDQVVRAVVRAPGAAPFNTVKRGGARAEFADADQIEVEALLQPSA